MPGPSVVSAATVVARLSTEGNLAQRIGDAFEETAEGVAVTEFDEGDGRWSLAIHFRHRPNETAVRALVALAAGPAAANALLFEPVQAQDWIAASLEALEPVEAGRFVVHGSHHRRNVRPNRIGIEIEAALAFGTGHHGTTRGCLLALDRLLKQQGKRTVIRDGSSRSGPPARVLDVGTGSGVLAIAAAKATRASVLASDNDGRAVEIARDNARLNRVAPFVSVVRADGLAAGRLRAASPFALVLANILLEPLERLAGPTARLVAPGACVVLSGVLAAQVNAVLARYRARGFALERRIALEGWVTLVLRAPRRPRAVAAPARNP